MKNPQGILQATLFFVSLSFIRFSEAGDQLGALHGFQRIAVGEDLSDQSSVSGCLSATCEAANAENIEQFVECFTASTQRKIRKPAAMLFVEHDVSMDLLDSKVIEQSATQSQVAVKYRARRSDDTFTIVSVVDLKKEDGKWRISKEKIHRADHQQYSGSGSGEVACFGGQCRLQ